MSHHNLMNTKKSNFYLILSGVLSGLINGFFGGGGGMIIVPLLICACMYKRKNAHATALSVMLPICVISSIIYAINGELDFSVILPVTIGFSVGGLIGALLLNKINDTWLKYGFSILILVAGVKLLFF